MTKDREPVSDINVPSAKRGSGVRERLINFKDRRFRQWNRGVVFPRDAKQIEKIINPTNSKKKISVVDIGSGAGGLSRAMHRRGMEVTATDVEHIHEFPEVPFVKGSVDEPLPFKDGAFDVSTIWFVLHHTEDPVSILKEAARVSDTVIVQEDIVGDKGPKWWRSWQERSYKKHVSGFSILNTNSISEGRTYTHDDWQKKFKEAGLKQVVPSKRLRRLGANVRRERSVFIKDEDATTVYEEKTS